MLKSIQIHNFRCVRDLTLNLTFAEGKAPNGYLDSDRWPFIQLGKGKDRRLCPVMALYGANASGKTSLLMAVQTLITLLKYGWRSESFQPNLIHHPYDDGSYSLLSLQFCLEKQLFHYSLAINKTGFEYEELQLNHVVLFRVEKGQIARMDKSLQASYQDILAKFNLRCIHAKTHDQVKTFLAEITDALPGVSPSLLEASNYLLTNILTVKGEIPLSVGIGSLADTFEGLEDERQSQAIKLILKYLHKLDIPIVNMQLEDVGTVDASQLTRAITLKTAHLNKFNQEVWFEINQESEGTRRLIGMLGYLLAAIRKGKIVCIDEIDHSLHSLLVLELIRLFKIKRINNNNAQIILTIHNTDLLSAGILGLSEIAIVTYRSLGGTHLLRLTDHQGLRNTDNFRRRYLNGEFGGIPSPYV